jgi:hypothetical protein
VEDSDSDEDPIPRASIFGLKLPKKLPAKKTVDKVVKNEKKAARKPPAAQVKKEMRIKALRLVRLCEFRIAHILTPTQRAE